MNERNKYFLTQKLVGILAILFGMWTIKLTHTATVVLLLVPVGVYMVFTKEKILTTKYFYEDEEEDL